MSNGAAVGSASRAGAEWTFDDESGGKSRESCVKHFDALWFCYSPVFQLQQLYRYGEVDDCTRHWRDFYDCLKKRTKFADQVVEKPKAEPLWQLRTPEEASTFWQEQFGSAAEGLPQQPASKSGRQTDAKEREAEKLTLA